MNFLEIVSLCLSVLPRCLTSMILVSFQTDRYMLQNLIPILIVQAKCTSAFEQSHEKTCSKTCSQGFRLGSTQTRLFRNIIYVDSLLPCVFIIQMYQNMFCHGSASEKLSDITNRNRGTTKRTHNTKHKIKIKPSL